MRKLIYVVSDLPLGGALGENGAVGFQMCPPRNQEKLAQFINELPSRDERTDVQLVIAGDVVDFLAEKPFAAFTGDPNVACRKLEHIIAVSQPVWAALQNFVGQRNGALTLLLGNHDVELCLPGVRQLLLATIGEGRVEFLYDNQAWTYGPVLVEHGNRMDAWNAVPHGALRRFRSQLSRGCEPSPFPALPGSQLVADVINSLKEQYSFVDLLKPETAGVLPILAALGAGSLKQIWTGFRKYRQTFAVDFDEDQQPIDETYIGAEPDREQKLFDLSEHIAFGDDATQIGNLREALTGARQNVAEAVREYRRRALFTALRDSANKHRRVFDVSSEIAIYEKAAKKAVQAGYQVVNYGHAHTAKRVLLRDRTKRLPVYFEYRHLGRFN
jgi:UDP-2,3-diacylglucosamine pyrophosphatase LpxH